MNPRLNVYATLWSVRWYPSQAEEWSWEKKFKAIREAGFKGIMSKPIPELAQRGDLAYWAIGSYGVGDDPRPFYADAKALGAVAATIQPCDVDTPLADCVAVAANIQKLADEFALPTGIECHRDTFTETPERTWDLCDAYEKAEGRPLPICFDHSHFAVVRHVRPPYWPSLKGREDILARTRQFHLRPFNGHHCQIPATFDGRRRTPEYLDWLEFVRELFRFLHARADGEIVAVPELGNANPAYGLSCFPDIWRDACVAGADIRKIWDDTNWRPQD